VRRGIQQHLVLVLAVQIDERSRRVAQRRRRHQRAVDERAAATLRRHFAAHDQFPAVRLLEHRLHRCRVFPRTHEIGARASADEESDGADENRFARAGLAGQNREPRCKFNFQAIDDGQIADTEKADHSSSVRLQA
jgi:hypothetical protein